MNRGLNPPGWRPGRRLPGLIGVGRIVVAVGVGAGLLAALVFGSGGIAAQGGQSAVLTAEEVVEQFRAAGLPLDQLRRDPVGGSPSGPPATEREAWSFTVSEVAPSGGRILVFGDGQRLQQKAAWFRRAGASVTVHQNIILWLDPGIHPSEAARYRQTLAALR